MLISTTIAKVRLFLFHRCVPRGAWAATNFEVHTGPKENVTATLTFITALQTLR